MAPWPCAQQLLLGAVNIHAGAVNGRFHGVDADGLLGQLVANGAKLGNWQVELHPLVGVLHAQVGGHLAGAQAGRGQLDAANIQDVEGNEVSLANLAENIFLRNLHVRQEHLPGRRALNAHLVLLVAEGQALGAALHDEAGELLAVNLGKHDEHVGKAGVGNPHFLAVEHVLLAVLSQHGLGFGAQGVGAGAGLGEAVGAHPFAGGQLGQVFLLLLLGAEVENRQHSDAGVGGKRHRKRVAAAHAFRHQ